jgi:hypothetical protein
MSGMNLIEGIQSECERVRGILPYYDEIGPVGFFGKMVLQQAIKEGEASIASGDVVRMVAALESLRGCKE